MHWIKLWYSMKVFEPESKDQITLLTRWSNIIIVVILTRHYSKKIQQMYVQKNDCKLKSSRLDCFDFIVLNSFFLVLDTFIEKSNHSRRTSSNRNRKKYWKLFSFWDYFEAQQTNESKSSEFDSFKTKRKLLFCLWCRWISDCLILDYPFNFIFYDKIWNRPFSWQRFHNRIDEGKWFHDCPYEW